MPVLSNVKHELFCQKMLEHNGSVKLVMAACGYVYNASWFAQLKRKPLIAARIEELQESIVSEKILSLQQRLEMLSDMARDTTIVKSIRIAALREIHQQSGDAINKVELSGSTKNVVEYVQIKLPQIAAQETQEDEKLELNALEGLDEFLADVDSNKTRVAKEESIDDLFEE